MMLRITLVILMLCTFENKALAQVSDSSFYEWEVYEMDGDDVGDKECYIVAHPKETITNHNSRKKPYVMITRYQEERMEEISIYGGYEYKINSEVFLFIDNKQYKLKANGDMAFTDYKNNDAEIIQRLLNSGTIRVRSDSSIGTFAGDEYSTKGIARAYARMKEICK